MAENKNPSRQIEIAGALIIPTPKSVFGGWHLPADESAADDLSEKKDKCDNEGNDDA
jgi:hypothetical protein